MATVQFFFDLLLLSPMDLGAEAHDIEEDLLLLVVAEELVRQNCRKVENKMKRLLHPFILVMDRLLVVQVDHAGEESRFVTCLSAADYQRKNSETEQVNAFDLFFNGFYLRLGT